MCIIVGDLHLKGKTPYYESYQFLLRWLQDNYIKEEMIFLGDVFDSSVPAWKIYNDFKSFLIHRKNKTYLLTGNHDISTMKGNSVLGFDLMDDVYVYNKPTEIIIENYNCLMLPFIYSNMKEQYENMKGEYDYIFTHITPPECAFGDEGINLNVTAKKILHGHTHIQKDWNNHIILGVPTSTRNLEHLQKHRIAEIKDDKVSFIEVPQYFTFRDVEYGDEIKEEWKNDIINVKNAPSIHSVTDKYKGYNIRESGTTLKEFDSDTDSEVFEFSEDALQNYFSEFKKEIELPDNKYNIISKYFNESTDS